MQIQQACGFTTLSTSYVERALMSYQLHGGHSWIVIFVKSPIVCKLRD